MMMSVMWRRRPSVTSRRICGLTAAALAVVVSVTPAWSGDADGFFARLAAAAVERTRHVVTYDGRYRSMSYPLGDVPDSTGVCTDVVVRSYRAVGIDLQERVHLDMSAHFQEYPSDWGLTAPDPNIDHRRVPNLQAFFRRQGAELEVTDDPADYTPGDIVTWRLPSNAHHIGIVVDRRSADGTRPLVVHNISRGPQVEDVLFRFPITGHFRFDGSDVREETGSVGSDS